MSNDKPDVSNPETKPADLTPGMKLEIHEIINDKIGKFAGNIQKVSVVLGLLLGFFGYKSCEEIKGSIKTEVKKEILNSNLDEVIKKDIRKTQMDGILNNLASDIQSDEFDEEVIRDEYIDLFNESFLDPNDKTIRIITTLNTIMQENGYSSDEFKFPNRPEGRKSLLAGINDLAKKTDDPELKFQCYKFLIYFSKDEKIPQLIESFKNGYLSNSNSSVSSFTDDLLILLTRRVTDQSFRSDNEKQTYLDNTTRLIKIANQIISSNTRDPYFQLSGYVTLLRLNEGEGDLGEKYSKSLTTQLDAEPNLINSLINVVISTDFITEDENSNFNKALAKILILQLQKYLKNTASNRNISYTRTIYPLAKKKPEFTSFIFDSLSNSLSRTTEEKIKVLGLFTRNPSLRLTNLYVSKFFGTLISKDQIIEISYDRPTKKYVYITDDKEKKLFNADSVKHLYIKFETVDQKTKTD